MEKSSTAKLILESFTYGLLVFMPFYFWTTYYWKEVSTMPPIGAPWGGKGIVSADYYPWTFYCKHYGEFWKCSFEEAFYTYIFGLIVVAILILPFLFIFHKYKSKES